MLNQGYIALKLALAMMLMTATAAAHHPKDPKVQALAGRGVEYLKREGAAAELGRGRIGGICLVAQAMFSYDGNYDDPLVQEAVARCRKYAESGELTNDPHGVYHMGFAINFLAKVSPCDPTIKPLMATLWQQLATRQRPDGSWSYPNYKTGDVSQTQYAAFSMWEIVMMKVDTIPTATVEALCEWLMRVQDPSGSWGYQGTDPGIGNFNRITQQDIRHSMAAAGAGSLYITADLLGLSKRRRDESDSNTKDAVFKEVKDDASAGADGTRRPENLDTGRLRGALGEADRWFDLNFSASVSRWPYYYLYGLERYKSFREKVEAITEKEPSWYNEGVEYLIGRQEADGSWYSGEGAGGVSVDTSFAILFLLRGTQTIIGDTTTEGTLRGGHTLPSDLKNLRLTEDGKVVAPTAEDQLKDLSELLASMEQRTDLDIETVDLSQYVIKKEVQQTEFERFVDEILGHPNYQKRLLGVRVLATRRENLDHVPVLIYALGDPDPRVKIAARDALRMISRKIDGFNMPSEPTDEQVRIAQAAWKRWYSSIRPDAQFEF